MSKPKLADWIVAIATVVIDLTSFYQCGAINGKAFEMRRAGIQTEKLIDAAKTSADAAQKAADTSDATLKASQKSFQIDQRPYVIADGPPQFVVPPNSDGLPVSANVVFKDIGRTPAIHSVWLVDLLPYKATTRPDYLRFLESSFAKLSKRQEYTTERHAAEMSRDIAPTATTFTSEFTKALSADEMRD